MSKCDFSKTKGQPKRRGKSTKVVLSFSDLRRVRPVYHQKFRKLLKGMAGRAR